jgi:hypothetical protein
VPPGGQPASKIGGKVKVNVEATEMFAVSDMAMPRQDTTNGETGDDPGGYE